jgi:hypothetical protein
MRAANVELARVRDCAVAQKWSQSTLSAGAFVFFGQCHNVSNRSSEVYYAARSFRKVFHLPSRATQRTVPAFY